MTRHFRVSVMQEADGFAVEVKEVDSRCPRRTLLFERKSDTNMPEEAADVVREAMTEMLRPVTTNGCEVSAR